MVKDVYVDLLSQAKLSVWATIYTYDHTDVNDTLCKKLRSGDGFEVRLIFDDSQMRKPSCRRQHERVEELLRAGARIRTVRLSGKGPCASLHSKNVLIDGGVLMTGSPNPTHNGFECNWECLAIVRTRSAPRQFASLFEELWATGVDFTQEVFRFYVEQSGRQPIR